MCSSCGVQKSQNSEIPPCPTGCGVRKEGPKLDLFGHQALQDYKVKITISTSRHCVEERIVF